MSNDEIVYLIIFLILCLIVVYVCLSVLRWFACLIIGCNRFVKKSDK